MSDVSLTLPSHNYDQTYDKEPFTKLDLIVLTSFR